MMLACSRLRLLPAKFATVLAFALLPCWPVQGQTSPTGGEPAAAGSTNVIAVAPNARDAEIADRLERILAASGWFSPLSVSVREGIVFIDGQTETADRRDWAQQLTLRTQDVVAVVNRIEVKPTVSWDFTPTWRELGRLVNRAQWLAPLAVISLLILLVFWLLSRGAAHLMRHALRRRLTSPMLVNLAARAVALPVILIGVYLVLHIAGLTRLAVTILGGTGLIGIVVGLAFREIAENLLASILLSVRNPFRTGDWIRVGEHQGIVQSLNMRTTVLLTLDGNHVLIPNAVVFKSVISNFSTSTNRRAEFSVGIGYADSIVEAQEVILRALRAHSAVLETPEPAALVEELGASTINLSVQFWFDGKTYSIFKVRSSLMRQVKRALQDAGISMPDAAREIIFPEGVPLSQALDDPGRAEARPSRPIVEDQTKAYGEPELEPSGEGDLTSEEAELQRSATSAVLPEGEINLLASDQDPPAASEAGKGRVRAQ